MLATPMGSSARAWEDNRPAAATPAVVCKNFLRWMGIALIPPFVEMASDQKSDPNIRVPFAYADRCPLRVLIQFAPATGLDRRGEADQAGLREMATDQHQT